MADQEPTKSPAPTAPTTSSRRFLPEDIDLDPAFREVTRKAYRLSKAALEREKAGK